MEETNKQILLTLLLVFAITNITLDYYLTDNATRQGRYYETNQFTNRVGLEAHAAILILFTSAAYVTGTKIKKSTTPINIFFVVFNTAWTLNNIYSLTLIF